MSGFRVRTFAQIAVPPDRLPPGITSWARRAVGLAAVTEADRTASLADALPSMSLLRFCPRTDPDTPDVAETSNRRNATESAVEVPSRK